MYLKINLFLIFRRALFIHSLYQLVNSLSTTYKQVIHNFIHIKLLWISTWLYSENQVRLYCRQRGNVPKQFTTKEETMLTQATREAITEHEIDAFTRGDCWALALDIHKQFGLPVVFFVGFENSLPENDEEIFWGHAFNRLPDGNYLDIHGIQSKRQIMECWSLKLHGNDKPAIVRPSHATTVKILSEFNRSYNESTAVAIRKLTELYNPFPRSL